MTGLFQAFESGVKINRPLSGWSNTAAAGAGSVEVVPAASNTNGLFVLQALFRIYGSGTVGEMYFGTYPFWKGTGWVSLEYAAKGISGFTVPAGEAVTIICPSGSSVRGDISGWLL